MSTILIAREDALSEGVVRILIDRLVPELSSQSWLRELWTDNLDSARSYERLPRQTHMKVPSFLTGRAKDLFRAFRSAVVEQERRSESLVLVFAHDTDRNEPSRTQLEQVRQLHQSQLVAILAEPTPEFDAWVLLGHTPVGRQEEIAFEAVKKELEFDPRHEVLRLNSTTGNERDVKRVCSRVLLLESQAKPEPCRPACS